MPSALSAPQTSTLCTCTFENICRPPLARFEARGSRDQAACELAELHRTPNNKCPSTPRRPSRRVQLSQSSLLPNPLCFSILSASQSSLLHRAPMPTRPPRPPSPRALVMSPPGLGPSAPTPQEISALERHAVRGGMLRLNDLSHRQLPAMQCSSMVFLRLSCT